MSYEQLRASLKQPALIAVAEHWNAVRAMRRMPGWRDIDPAAIKVYLPMVWAWRWDASLGTFVGRLAGEDIIAVLGTNPRGKRLAECFPAKAVDAVLARYRRIIEEPALMRSEGKIYSPAGHEGWGERVVLPLAGDGEHGDGIIGATFYRLDIRPVAGEVSIDHLNEEIDFFPLP